MKRLVSAFLCLSIIGGIASCSKETTITKSNDEVTTTTTAQDTEETVSDDEISAIGDIDVDEGLLSVTVTIPADIVGEDESQETVDKTVADKGYISGTYNADGSVTYVMTKAKHKEALKELSESLDKSLQEIVDSEDYPNIVEIAHNEDYTDFTIRYKGDEVGFGDSFTILVYYYAGAFYGVFSGNKADNVHVAFVNADTGAVIQEADSKNMGSSETE